MANNTKTTWRTLVLEAMGVNGESWTSVVSHGGLDEDFDEVFAQGEWTRNCVAFTIWTSDHVYIPITALGVQSVVSAPRGFDTTRSTMRVKGYNLFPFTMAK